jgi:hypothetical protein
MKDKETDLIFQSLVSESLPERDSLSLNISDVHRAIAFHFRETDANVRDLSRSAVMTMRNSSAAMALMEFEQCPSRDACHVAYVSPLPTQARSQFQRRLHAIGPETSKLSTLRDEIARAAEDMNLHPHTCFLDCVVDAVLAARAGLHVLLEGPSGCGLSAIAHFVASFCVNTSHAATPWSKEIPFVLLWRESTIENIIGAFQPPPLQQGEDVTHLIQWEKGPLLTAGLHGVPLILNRISTAKAQVTERVNPIQYKWASPRNNRSSAVSL